MLPSQARHPYVRSIPGNIPHSSVPPPYFLEQPSASKASVPGMVWKAILIPPLAALLIYLSIVYIFLPLYRRRARYAQYIPVSITSSYTPGPKGFLGRVRDWLDALSPFSLANGSRRRHSQASVDSIFGDEELEEGYGIGDIVHADRTASEARDERRLSRELEVGFRDDSDDDEHSTSAAGSRSNNTRASTIH